MVKLQFHLLTQFFTYQATRQKDLHQLLQLEHLEHFQKVLRHLQQVLSLKNQLLLLNFQITKSYFLLAYSLIQTSLLQLVRFNHQMNFFMVQTIHFIVHPILLVQTFLLKIDKINLILCF